VATERPSKPPRRPAPPSQAKEYKDEVSDEQTTEHKVSTCWITHSQDYNLAGMLSIVDCIERKISAAGIVSYLFVSCIYLLSSHCDIKSRYGSHQQTAK
jgi:hypothetical protein